jgi:hypothetical protein
MFSLRSAARGQFRTICRSASLLAMGLSLLIFHHVQPIAAKVYNDLCAMQGITYGVGMAVEGLGITMLAVAVPLLLARSNVLIVVNLITGLITLFGAGTLLSTAGDTPYECFTSGGTYEDHTSGLEGFDFWLTAMVFFAYVFLLIDLIVWAIIKAVAFRRAAPAAP